MEKENMLSELKKYIQEEKFIKIVFSDRQDGDFSKIIIKPLSLKTGKNIQIESFKDNKAFHKNVDLNNLPDFKIIGFIITLLKSPLCLFEKTIFINFSS